MIFHWIPYFLFGVVVFPFARGLDIDVKKAMKQHKMSGVKKLNAMFKEVKGVKPAAGDITTGWAYTSFYADLDCAGSPLQYAGYALGVCLPNDGGSVFYTAEDSGGLMTIYKDVYGSSDCSGGVLSTSTLDYSTTCNSGAIATTTSDTNFPYTLSNGYLAVESADDACDLNSHFDFQKPGCYFYLFFSVKISCSGSDALNMKVYASTDCTGDSDGGKVPLATTCTETIDDDVYDIDDFDLEDPYVLESCDGSSSDDSSTCFSAFETVTTSNGEQVAISEVKVGDKILTVTANGEQKFADVVFIPHAANNQISATFHLLETSSGRTLKATRDHLIEAGECGMSKGLVAIDSVSADMCVMTVDGEERVVSNVMSKGQGVYTVITSESSGKIVVNGMIASSFGTNHVITNAYYNIHRAIYSFMPSMLKSMTTVMVNGMFGEVMAKGAASM